MPFIKTQRLNRICVDKSNFDNLCNKLETWLLSKKMKQILRACDESRESIFDKIK